MSDGEQDEPRNFYLWSFQQQLLSAMQGFLPSSFSNSLMTRLNQKFFLSQSIVTKESEHPRAVVEPHLHEFKATDFERVLELAEELDNATSSPTYAYYEENPNAGEAWLERSQRRDFCANVRRAVHQTVSGACIHDKQKVFISGAREVGPFIVFSVLLIPENNYESHPRLHQTKRGQYSVVPSLLDASANTFVSECYNAILSSLDGAAAARFPDVDTMLRSAGESFMHTPCTELAMDSKVCTVDSLHVTKSRR